MSNREQAINLTILHVSYSLSSGQYSGVTKGDTRSLDYGSYGSAGQGTRSAQITP